LADLGRGANLYTRLCAGAACAGTVATDRQGRIREPTSERRVGHVAFDYIESRWGRISIRRFINALIVPRVDKTYDVVFDLTPEEFDAAFRQYAERRFGSVVR
jgi:hypothetical protein